MKNEAIAKAVEIIKKYEGFSAKPYICPAGKPTIGYGNTFYPDGRKVEMTDQVITKAQAKEYLEMEVEEKAEIILKFLMHNGIVLNSNELAAILSFAYNVGIGPVISGGKLMNIALRSHDRNQIAEAILKYNKATINGVKQELKGLTLRRESERKLFLTKIDQTTTPTVII